MSVEKSLLKNASVDFGIEWLLSKVNALGFSPREEAKEALVGFAQILMASPGTLSHRDRNPQVVLEHLEDCASALEVLPTLGSAESIADLGSGNGLPGVVIALLIKGTHTLDTKGQKECERPKVYLLERSRRKAAFLRRVCIELRVPAEVCIVGNFGAGDSARGGKALPWGQQSWGAPELGGERGAKDVPTHFSVVLARAVAPLENVPALLASLMAIDGSGLVWAGSPTSRQKEACVDACRLAGLVGKWEKPSLLRSRGNLLVLKFEADG